MNIKILVAIVFLALGITVGDAKLSEYDIQQIQNAWEEPQLKEIFKEIKKYDVSRQFFDSMRVLDGLKVNYDSKEQKFKSQLDDVQTKCLQQKTEVVSQIKKLKLQKGMKDGYQTQNKQVELYLIESQQQYSDILKSSKDILTSLNQERQQIQKTLQSQLDRNAKVSQNLESVMKALVMVKNSPFQSNQYRSSVSQYVQALQNLNKEDPLRILMESFNKVFIQNNIALINDMLEILVNLVKNNKSELEYIQKSKDLMMKNFKEQKDMIELTIKEAEQQILKIEGVQTNFADLFELSDNIEDITQKPKEPSSIKALEGNKQNNEKACNKEVQQLLGQYEINKNRRQFVQTLISYMKLDSDGVQQKLASLK